MKYGIVILTALLILPTIASATRGRLARNLERGLPQTLVVYGTSIESNRNGHMWVGRVGEELGRRYSGRLALHNAGMSGQNSRWALENLADSVLAYRPDAVVIEFATNDAVTRFGISPEDCRRNTEELIACIKAAYPACEIILMTACGYPLGEGREKRPDLDAYNDVYRSVARRHRLPLVDVAPLLKRVGEQQGIEVLKVYARDGIHPTVQGALELFYPSLTAVLIDGRRAAKNLQKR